MSERIKRYTALYDDAFGTISPLEHKSGEFALYTDVAALEAENARLRRIVEAGETAINALSAGDFYTIDRALKAYGAAKSQPPSQVSAKVNSPEVDNNHKQQ